MSWFGDILADVPGHVRPLVIPRDEFEGFESAGMSSDFGVMAEEYDASAKIRSGWDIDVASKVKEAVSF